MPRIQAVIEIGPHQGSPYANWGVYEISPNAFEDMATFEFEMTEVESVLDEVDTGESPYGGFSKQVRDFLLSTAARIDATYEQCHPGAIPSAVRRDFTLPYDQAHREQRDAEEEVDDDSIDPRDLQVSVKVEVLEEDS